MNDSRYFRERYTQRRAYIDKVLTESKKHLNHRGVSLYFEVKGVERHYIGNPFAEFVAVYDTFVWGDGTDGIIHRPDNDILLIRAVLALIGIRDAQAFEVVFYDDIIEYMSELSDYVKYEVRHLSTTELSIDGLANMMHNHFGNNSVLMDAGLFAFVVIEIEGSTEIEFSGRVDTIYQSLAPNYQFGNGHTQRWMIALFAAAIYGHVTNKGMAEYIGNDFDINITEKHVLTYTPK